MLTVILIMTAHLAYTYLNTKQNIIEEMQQSSRLSIVALEKNVGNLMMSYAINEYDRLVFTEMAQRNIFAIIVEDYNMGKIIGKESYVSGKIRDTESNILDYDPDNSEHARKVTESFYSDKYEITDPSGLKLGSISIYITDNEMNKRLDEIISATTVDTIAISLLLILSLFITIRIFILTPLSNIISTIKESDVDGIPIGSIPKEGPREIALLSNTMNKMITSIKESRVNLRKHHESLQLEKDRFQLAIDGTNNGLWDWNLQTDEVIHSARFETMLGYSEGELPDTIECWSGLLHPDDKEQAYQKVNDYLTSKGKGVYENTFRMRTKSGEWRWVTGRGKALFKKDGTPVRFVGFNSDITDWKRMQSIMMQTEKMMSVGGLAAGMAHELNNPLGGVLQGIQNVRRRMSPDLEKNRLVADETGVDLNRVKTYMERRGIDAFLLGVAHSGEQAASIVQNMLKFSRKPDQRKQLTSINEVIEKTLDLANVDFDLKKHFDFHSIKIDKDYDQSDPKVLCIESEIQQVLLNILRNAAHALFNIEPSSQSPNITIRTFNRSDMVCIEIEDNGPGMEESVSKRVFEPFYTTKDVGEGTGLGLSISYFIITNEHSGNLSLESSPGRGSTFRIELPKQSEAIT